ncbi:hypothetical protein JCM16303_002528 [Sporobolomyces ruberrimus]
MPDTSRSTPEDRIQSLLEQAQCLHRTLSSEPIHSTWAELCELIETGDLGDLTRHPVLEELYTSSFNPLIKQTYGSVETYLRTQLAFDNPSTSTIEEKEWWDSQEATRKSKRGGSQARVRKNDWGYSIPKGVEHYVVWVNRPLFHPALCQEFSSSSTSTLPTGSNCENRETTIGDEEDEEEMKRNTWEFVQEHGVSGLTGMGSKRSRTRRRNFTHATTDSSLEKAEEEEVVTRGPGREIENFVRNEWKVKEGYETAWFANPPRLQSVPGLAHFHVMVKKTI